MYKVIDNHAHTLQICFLGWSWPLQRGQPEAKWVGGRGGHPFFLPSLCPRRLTSVDLTTLNPSPSGDTSQRQEGEVSGS